MRGDVHACFVSSAQQEVAAYSLAGCRPTAMTRCVRRPLTITSVAGDRFPHELLRHECWQQV